MRSSFSSILNTEKTLDMLIENPKRILFNKKHHVFLNDIIGISISKKLVILTIDEPLRGSYETRDERFNNIKAYDFDGNLQWEICDIVGDVHYAFWGGAVKSYEDILKQNHFLLDYSKLNDNNEYFYLTSMNDTCYIIDLTTKQEVFRYTGK